MCVACNELSCYRPHTHTPALCGGSFVFTGGDTVGPRVVVHRGVVVPGARGLERTTRGAFLCPVFQPVFLGSRDPVAHARVVPEAQHSTRVPQASHAGAFSSSLRHVGDKEGLSLSIFQALLSSASWRALSQSRHVLSALPSDLQARAIGAHNVGAIERGLGERWWRSFLRRGGGTEPAHSFCWVYVSFVCCVWRRQRSWASARRPCLTRTRCFPKGSKIGIKARICAPTSSCSS